ncbi:MAG: hypothetical protein ACTSUR_08710 [Candidatus Heimdallarchaeaceae archaeon]
MNKKVLMGMFSMFILGSMFISSSSYGINWFYFDDVDIGNYTIEMPVIRFILYDPYGIKSFQRITITTSHKISWKLSLKEGNSDIFQVTEEGKYERKVTESESFYSSKSSSLTDCGPGIGDRIVYDLVRMEGILHGDIRWNPIYGLKVDRVDYYRVDKTEKTVVGILSRADFDSMFSIIRGELKYTIRGQTYVNEYSTSSDIVLPNKTGTEGNHHLLIQISADTIYERSFTIEWSAGASITIMGNIPIPVISSLKVEFKTEYTNSKTMQAFLHIENDEFLEFYIESDGKMFSDRIEDLIYWFSPVE